MDATTTTTLAELTKRSHTGEIILPNFVAKLIDLGVEQAIGHNQRGEHTYHEFLQKTMAAGCVGYFVLITGRRALYFGRNGEVHVEPFPPPK